MEREAIRAETLMWTAVRLERKLLGVVLLVLLSAGSGLTAVVVVAAEREEEKQAAHTARGLSKAIEGSLRSAMLSGDRDVLRVAVETVASQAEVDTVAVIDDTGRTVVQVGQQGNRLGAVQALVDEARSSDQVLGSAIGRTEYAVVSPVRTESACARCHGDKPTLGFVSAVVSTAAERNRIRGIRNRLLGGGVASLAITCIALYLAVNKWVTRPVVALNREVDEMWDSGSDDGHRVLSGDEIARLAESFESMRAQITEKTEALLDAERGLEQSKRLASIGLLAAGVAHEIGSPLTAIQLRAGFWKEHSEGPVQAAASAIAGAAQQIADLRRELLTFDRGESIQFSECDLRAILRDCCSLVEGPGLRCELDVPEHPVVVLADRELLARAIGNVLRNAAQAMRGQGTVSVRVGKEDGGLCGVTVRDTGSGLPPEDVARIFEPFFTSRKTRQASGLGLAIAREIIARHNGEITAMSVSEGGCFRILLPLKQPEGENGDHSNS